MGDPWIEPTDDELLMSYADMQGGLYGKNPAQRLNFGQDLLGTLKTLGVDLTTLVAPGAASEVPQYVEPMNQTGAIYGNDQVFASVFQAIEQDVDPISAAKAARDQGLFKGTPDDFNRLVEIATQYAGERVQNTQARSQWEAENGGGWTLPDGTRAKTNPMGGNSAMATASEYDLLGAPDPEALFDQYVQQNGTRPKMTPGAGISASAGPANSNGYGWTAGARPETPMAPTAIPSSPGKNLPPGVVDYTPTPTASATPGLPLAASSGNPQPRNAAPRLAGGDFFLEKAAKDSINNRVEQSKNTRVRSDANAKAMRSIMAMAALMQGDFPQ